MSDFSTPLKNALVVALNYPQQQSIGISVKLGAVVSTRVACRVIP